MKQTTVLVAVILGLGMPLVSMSVSRSLSHEAGLAAESGSLSEGPNKTDVTQASEMAFAEFKVILEPNEKTQELDVKGSFTLRKGNDGIDLFKEKTAITVANMSAVIPPNLFKQGSKGKVEFRKLIECTYWDLFIRAMGNDTFEFHLELQGVKSPEKIKHADVFLSIGNDGGKAMLAS